MSYNPATREQKWEVSTTEKGTRYSVVRSDTKGDVAALPYGLTADCKALATFVAATPELFHALRAVMTALEYDQDSDTMRIASDSPFIEQALYALSQAAYVPK